MSGVRIYDKSEEREKKKKKITVREVFREQASSRRHNDETRCQTFRNVVYSVIEWGALNVAAGDKMQAVQKQLLYSVVISNTLAEYKAHIIARTVLRIIPVGML